MISPCFLSPLSVSVLTKIKPSGAVSTVVLMSVGALALGCAIALLARAELGISSSPSKRKAAQKPSRTRPSDSCEKRFLPRHIHKPLLRSKRYELAEGKPDSENFSDEAYYTSENEKEEQDQEILCAVASSAERQGSYSDGVEYVESNVENEDYAQFGSAKYKTEINLDVIAQKFSAGDLVTLDALKRKRLVPKKTDYVKILARGALSKPLIIEANDFSRAAEEMLVALGGEAIRVKR
jgi:large subunit ribosomal protein L15